MEKSFIEVNLTNPSPYTLHIKDINLLIDNNQNLGLIYNQNKSLSEKDNIGNSDGKGHSQEIVKNDNKFFYANNSNSCLVEPDEEINFSFTVLNYKAFINSVSCFC